MWLGVGVACFGILRGQILFKFFFFTFFLKLYFFLFFIIFFICGGTLILTINICSTCTHSFTQLFFCVLLGSVSVGR